MTKEKNIRKKKSKRIYTYKSKNNIDKINISDKYLCLIS